MSSERVYYIFIALISGAVGFTLTLYVPLMTEDNGFTLSQVAFVNMTYWLSIIIFEVPTGMLADGRGRGWSITVGSLIMVLSGLFFAFGKSIEIFIVAEIMAGISYTFFSGALTSWIADAPDRTEKLVKIYGRATVIRGILFMTAPLIGGYIAQLFNRRVSFIVLSIVYLLAFIFAIKYMHGEEEEHSSNEYEALKSAWKHLKNSKALRWISVVQFSFGLFVVVNLYWTPFMLEKVTQVQLVYVWIAMYGAVTLSGLFLVKYAPIQKNEAKMMLLGILVATIPLFFFNALTSLEGVVSLLVVHEVGRGMLNPLVTAYIDNRVPADYRATIQSLGSFIGSMGYLIVLGVVSLIIPNTDAISTVIPNIWFITGIILTSFILLLYIKRPKVSC